MRLGAAEELMSFADSRSINTGISGLAASPRSGQRTLYDPHTHDLAVHLAWE